MRAWVLNLDAEGELEAGRRYSPSARVVEAVRSRAADFARGLPPGDVVLAPGIGAAPGALRESLASRQGRAFCPTPQALAIARTWGVVLSSAPDVEVLRRVNERGFATELADGELPGALRAIDEETVLSRVARPGLTGEWLAKRGFGQAGRGQRPLRAGAVSEADRAWIAASLRRGALYVEPRVTIVKELSVHGWVKGDVDLRTIREMRTGPSRAFLDSTLARDLDARTEQALVDTAERVGRALAAAGYFGPFGVDAFSYRTPSGSLALRTLSEINARFCMGWDARDGWDPPP